MHFGPRPKSEEGERRSLERSKMHAGPRLEPEKMDPESLEQEPQEEYDGSPRALHCGRLGQTPNEGPSEQPEKKTRED